MTTVRAASFQSWPTYFGDLAETVDAGLTPGAELRAVISGFQSDEHEDFRPIVIPQTGTAFGFVVHGGVRVTDSLMPDFPTTVGPECHSPSPDL